MTSAKRPPTVGRIVDAAMGAVIAGVLATGDWRSPNAYAQQPRGGDELKISDGYLTLITAKKHAHRVQASFPKVLCCGATNCQYLRFLRSNAFARRSGR